MFVNRKKIRIGSSDTGVFNINIPIQSNPMPLDNEDLVNSTFIDKEVQKSVNTIIDYKKVRYKPAIVKNGKWIIVPEIKIVLNFIDEDGELTNTYDSLGFSSVDLFCRVNKLMKSYLALDYYNTNISSQNILLASTNVYTQIGDDQTANSGMPKKSNQCPISYRMGSPTLRPDMVHEGFHIYWYDSVMDQDGEYVMYLSPTYQNAGNGKVSIMTPYGGEITPLNSEDLQYTKVRLKYYNGNFLYTFEANDERQLKENGGGIDWNDNSGSIPTITFFETLPNNSDSRATDIQTSVSEAEKSDVRQKDNVSSEEQTDIEKNKSDIELKKVTNIAGGLEDTKKSGNTVRAD